MNDLWNKLKGKLIIKENELHLLAAVAKDEYEYSKLKDKIDGIQTALKYMEELERGRG